MPEFDDAMMTLSRAAPAELMTLRHLRHADIFADIIAITLIVCYAIRLLPLSHAIAAIERRQLYATFVDIAISAAISASLSRQPSRRLLSGLRHATPPPHCAATVAYATPRRLRHAV
jgi:multidrug transporter EmrE-like cation transporter